MQFLAKNCVVPILLFGCLTVMSCAPSVTYIPITETGPSKGLADPIDVYMDDHGIPYGATVIGEVHVRDTGFSGGCGFDNVISIVKDRARENGADGIYVVSVLKPDFLSTCYRMTARLLRYPPIALNSPSTPLELPEQTNVETTWRRTVPEPFAIINLLPEDTSPSPKLDKFERAADAVVGLSGSLGTGTAFLITRDGLALTNHHVIENQVGLRGNLRDGRKLAARVLRTNAGADVALIQVDCSTDCFTLEIAQNNPRVGKDVYVIGNPLALDYSFTTGVVSGLRLAGSFTYVQTDAALNRGNSGGPIIDTETGKVIAIVAWKVSGKSIEGLGFGVAIQDALRVVGVQWQ